ncbi:MAG: delta-60 repeat domain-containing protein [Pyrinomonadaceae bacterium]|nr:delta-60 repeat domain-containing protein [Pyrinomonadaceae bacterium]
MLTARSTQRSTSEGVGVAGRARITSLDIGSDAIFVTRQGISTYNGVTIRGVFRLNADGSLDTSFSSGFTTATDMEDAEIQPDGKIVIVGYFESYGGQTANGDSKAKYRRHIRHILQYGNRVGGF